LITLAERLGALNIEIGIQTHATQVEILVALGDIIRTGGNAETLKQIAAALRESAEFSKRASLKLESIQKLGGTNAS
jgi:hypothetical protein